MNDEQKVPPLPDRRVAVWPHTLGDFEHFDDAVAIIQANGALLVWRWGFDPKRGDVPLKGYAPGAWVTYEHLGSGYKPNLFAPQNTPVPPPPPRTGGQQDEEPAPRSRADDPDPFVQLAPEALNAEDEQRQRQPGHRRLRTGELRTTRYAEQEANSPVLGPDQVIELGGDGDDEAFRRSGDALPLADPEPGDDSDATGGGVAQCVRAALAPIGQRLRKSAKSLWQGFSMLDPLSPTHPHLPQLPPGWYTSTPVLTAMVLMLTPVMLYLSISAN